MRRRNRRATPPHDDGTRQITLPMPGLVDGFHPDSKGGRVWVEGEVASITHRSEEGEWVTGTLEPQSGGRRVTFVASGVAGLEIGRHVRLAGFWEVHPAYGVQLNVQSGRSELPRHRDALIRYIAANVDACGPARASVIVEALGPTCLDALASDPARAQTLFDGAVAERVAAGWRRWATEQEDDQVARDLAVRLMEAGVTYRMARRVLRFFRGRAAAEIVALREPYRLMDVPGVGWRRADRIARSLGVPTDDPDRLAAAVVHTLDGSMLAGHSALPHRELVRRVRDLLGDGITASQIITAIGECEEASRIVEDGGLRYTPDALRAEWAIANALASHARAGGVLPPAEQAAIDRILSSSGLSAMQMAAVRMALENGVSVLTGRPGSGKTTTLRTFIECCMALRWTVKIAAPTGKAAARAKEVTGVQAGTVHRLIGGAPGTQQPSPIPAAVLVVDEASMLDAEIAAWLFRNLSPSTRVLLVGDADQLPSVGHGNVLADLIASGRIPGAELREVFRQARESRIIANAHRLLDGESLQLDPAADFIFADITLEKASPDERSVLEQRAGQKRLLSALRWLADTHGVDPAVDVQVLAPTRRGLLGVDALNELLQDALNPSGELGPEIGGGIRVRVGDRVIQTRNDYHASQEGLFNGEQGMVVAVDARGGTACVRFDGRTLILRDVQLYSLRLAWAITVHRSQGSEWPHVVLAYHSSHGAMLDRSLLYTALTRAKRGFILIGDQTALAQTRPRLLRHTGLVAQIRKAIT